MSERVHGHVTQGAESITPVSQGVLQRTCACGAHTMGSGQCRQCKNGDRLQRKALGASHASGVPPIVNDVLSSPGQPLDVATRAYFEPRFHHDFSKVRLHSGREAAESARAVGATGFTVGRHIVLGASPGASIAGDVHKTIAHELAHTIQQEGTDVDLGAGLRITSPNDRSEREAEAAADEISRPDSASLLPEAAAGPTGRWSTQPDSMLSGRAPALQRLPEAASSSHSRKVFFPFKSGTSSEDGASVMTAAPPDYLAKAKSACDFVWQVSWTGFVDLKGGCANAKDDSSDQDKRKAVWIANWRVKWIRELLDRECGPLSSNQNIRVSQTPSGGGTLPPKLALSAFPGLSRHDVVEVTVGTP